MDHLPGTTTIGDTLPSSAVTGLSSAGSSTALRPRTLFARAEHDGVVGLVRTGDVHLVDARVRGEVLADGGVTVDDAEDAGVDERRQGSGPVRQEIVVDRVRLHHDDLALDEELREHVARAERRHVARREDEGRARVGDGSMYAAAWPATRAAGDAELHPDLGRGLGERDPIESARRDDLDTQAAVGRLAHRAGERGSAVLRDVAQRVAEQARHAYEGADAGEQLLARLGRTRLETLGLARRGEPVVLRRHGGVDHILQQRRPHGRVGLRPTWHVIGDERDDGIERFGVDGRRRCGRRVAARRSSSRSLRLICGRGNRPAARDGHRSSSPARHTMSPPVGVGLARITGIQRTDACLDPAVRGGLRLIPWPEGNHCVLGIAVRGLGTRKDLLAMERRGGPVGITKNGNRHVARLRGARPFRMRGMGAAAAALLCGMFGLGAIAVSGVPSGAATSATLYVDNVNGTATTGCTSSGAGACKTIQQGVTAAEALTGTAVTLDVAGSATTYPETATSGVTINLPSGPGDSLDIEGTGSTPPTLNNGGTGSNVTIPSTSAGAVTIDNMTISGGHATTTAGGAIFDVGTGTLTVGHDTFSNNQETGGNDGGAIDAVDGCNGGTSGNVVVTNSTFVNNTGTSDGGAIDAHDFCGPAPTGTLTVSNSTFQSNTATFGGAISAWNAAAP